MSELREVLDSRWDEITSPWPGVVVTLERFAAHIESLHGHDPQIANVSHVSDLFLATGCSDGDAAAIAAFERMLIPQTVAAIRGLDSAAAFVDEVQQRVRTRLLVGEAGKKPRIAEFRGRGPLAAWVTVSAIRAGLSLMRESTRAARFGDERWAATIVLPEIGDPEKDHLKARYREEIGEALSNACQSLEDRERAVLRMYFADGLNIEKIGKVYGVHRSTVARWITRACDQITERTREFLVQSFDLPREELSSVNRLVRSQLDISLDGLLGTG